MGKPRGSRLPHTRRRQWGSERRRDPLPTVHARPSEAKLVWARIAIIVTIGAWIAYIVSTVVRQILQYGTESLQLTLEAVLYAVIVTFLTFSALMYLIAREGALRRFRAHERVPRAELDHHFAGERRDGLTVLIPSYAEEPSVIISRRPCALLKYVKHNPPLSVDQDKCVGCKACLGIACPAISYRDGKAVIDSTQCVGCGVCKGLCPKQAIG